MVRDVRRGRLRTLGVGWGAGSFVFLFQSFRIKMSIHRIQTQIPRPPTVWGGMPPSLTGYFSGNCAGPLNGMRRKTLRSAPGGGFPGFYGWSYRFKPGCGGGRHLFAFTISQLSHLISQNNKEKSAGSRPDGWGRHHHTSGERRPNDVQRPPQLGFDGKSLSLPTGPGRERGSKAPARGAVGTRTHSSHIFNSSHRSKFALNMPAAPTRA